MKNYWLGFAALLVLFGVVGYVVYRLSNLGIQQANQVAQSLNDSNIQISANFVNDPNVPTIFMKVDQAYAQANFVRFYGELTITPPGPGCTPTSISKMDENEVDISWTCGPKPVFREYSGFHLTNPPEWAGMLWTYQIIPTGINP